MTSTSDPYGAVGVIRITTFAAAAGQAEGLLGAARANAADARAAGGCRSAEACVSPGDPGTVLVVSRWEREADLRAFLDRHESHAHGTVSPYAARPPSAVHYTVADRP